MAGEGQKISAEGGDVDRQVGDGLRRVDQHQRPGGVGRLGQRGDVVDRAQHVRHGRHAQELCSLEDAGQVGQVEVPVGREGDPAQLDAPLGGQHVPGDDVGVVLHVGEDDDVAGGERGAAPGVGHQVGGLGCAPGEDDLPGGGGVDEPGGLGPGRLVGGGGLLGEGVHAPVDVGVVLLVVLVEGVEHGPGLLGGGGRVEVHEPLAVDPAVEDREVGPEPGQRPRGVDGTHGATSAPRKAS